MLLYYDIVRGYFLIDNSLVVCVSQFHAAPISTLPFMKFVIHMYIYSYVSISIKDLDKRKKENKNSKTYYFDLLF